MYSPGSANSFDNFDGIASPTSLRKRGNSLVGERELPDWDGGLRRGNGKKGKEEC